MVLWEYTEQYNEPEDPRYFEYAFHTQQDNQIIFKKGSLRLLFRVNVLKHLLGFGSQNPNKNQYGLTLFQR